MSVKIRLYSIMNRILTFTYAVPVKTTLYYLYILLFWISMRLSKSSFMLAIYRILSCTFRQNIIHTIAIHILFFCIYVY